MPNINKHETKEHFYARAGMSARMGFGRKLAVVVIDEQKGLTDPACALGSNLDSMVENSIVLINAAKKKHVPVIYTVAAFKSDLSDAGVFGKKVHAIKDAIIGTKWTELDDRLPFDSTTDHLLVKKMQSGFFGTPLLSILAFHEVDTILMLGCSTSGCLRASVQDGMAYGFRVIVPRECVGDRLREAHESNLFDMDAKLADVISLREAVDYLDALP